MRVIKPIDIIGNSELISSNLPANDFAVFNSATAYTTGQKVTYSNHNYEALTATTGQFPNISPVAWLDLGATNRAAPFDEKIGTKAVGALQIDYKIKPIDLVSNLSLLGLQGSSAMVTMTDSVAGLVYQRTIDLSDSEVEDWHQYFFANYENKEVAIFDDLPAYAGADIDINIASSGTVELGTLIAGYQAKIGEPNWGVSIGITDYSRKVRDEFGNATLLKRAFSSKVSVALEIESGLVNKSFKTLANLRATPCLYLVVTQYESTYVYGYFKDFNITIQGTIKSVCNLEIEGLI